MVIAFRDFSMYQLSGEALRLADHLIVIMSFVIVGMSYQMPVSAGIIQGGGDTKFNMVMSMVSPVSIQLLSRLKGYPLDFGF